ncbi:response regulator transcription factor [filamentous cyanobacterium LEGE 11480]|uniref:Response regulator transcription factor n=1 Tax=Romeriopsis navalis LEGE 11480 TaxID=2777977 RepID=A0A928VQ44_9CYAN|nr:response regulator transcription factor [Romeriopsis navalis]MBE9032430.1 response regulator transcription factor [Romeriopsis navalis LEGE 11480]
MTQFRILVVDDHEMVLSGTTAALKTSYPDAEIFTANTAQQGLEQLKFVHPNVLLLDLSMPDDVGDTAKVDTGIQLLRQIMEENPAQNIVVQSAHVKTLIRIKSAIANHEGGFTIVDKSLSMKEMLKKVNWAAEGVVFTPKEMRNGIEMKAEWLEVLQLAFGEGLQDKAIARRMNVAERTVRHYWSKIQDVLDVYPYDGKNIRIQTEKRARAEGLID